MPRVYGSLIVLAIVLTVAAQANGAGVMTTDFIPDAGRTHFCGFESLPNTHNSDFHTEDGINVTQVNGEAHIWSTYTPGGREGLHCWYPDAGDFGYTQISLASGLDFGDVGLLVGSGWSSRPPSDIQIMYELWDDGSLAQAGTLPWGQTEFAYLGFSGGGFDAVLIRDYVHSSTPGFHDGTLQAAAIDGIETADLNAIPEPCSLLLLGLGVAGLAGLRRRR